MASIVLGVVGAGVGSIFGNPMLGWSIGTLVGGLLFPARGEPQNRGRLDDLRVTGSAYGTMIPLSYGAMRLGGNIIWAMPLKEHISSQDQGGKGGGGGTTVNTYTYTVSFALMICQGPVTKINKIWAEDKLIYDDSASPKTSANITIYLGTEVQGADPTISSLQGDTPAYRGECYAVFTDFDLTPYGNRIPALNVEVITPLNTTGGILADVCGRAGLTSSDYDFSAATESVTGYLIPSRQAAKSGLEPLMRAFAADLVEVDGKVKYVPRGGGAAGTFAAGDLGAKTWNGGVGADVNLLDIKRQQDLELPARVDVTYFSINKSYQQASQGATRYTKQSRQDALTVTLPMALDDTSARRIAERLLYAGWIERTHYQAAVGPKYLFLAPGDVMNVPAPNGSVRGRVMGMDIPLFGEILLSLVQDDTNILNQVAGGGNAGAGGSGNNTLFTTAIITAYAWNGNALRDEDTTALGVYLAASGPSGWGGCTVFISKDGGNSWQQLVSISDYTPMGTALSVLASFTDTGNFDTADTVDVQIGRGTLSGVGYWDVINGANACLIGGEVVQFETVTVIDLPAGKFRLSNLLRGRRGTETAAGSHVIGEPVALLGASVKRMTFDLSLLNKAIQLKFIPYGSSLGAVSPVSVTLSGAEFKPYAGCALKGSRDGSNNLTVTWVRRTRSGGQWADGKDADLVDTPESYDVEVWDSTYTTLKRTFAAVGSPSQVYSAAQQTTDFGSAQATVYCRIYQNNATVGRGYALQGAV